ncbi:MAG: hypothetical protein ACOYXM_17800 [Actinomycetota bacterium]
MQGHGLERLDVFRYNLRHLTTRAIPSPTLNFKAIDATLVKRFGGTAIGEVDYKYTFNAARRGVCTHREAGIEVRVPKGIVVPGTSSATVSADELERLHRIASTVGPTLHDASMTAARRAVIAVAACRSVAGVYRVADGSETWEHLAPDAAWAAAEAAIAAYTGTAVGGVAAAGVVFLFTVPVWVPVVVVVGVTIGVGVGVHKGATALRATRAGEFVDAIIGDLVGFVGQGFELVGIDELVIQLGLDRLVLTVGDAVKKVSAAVKKAPVSAKQTGLGTARKVPGVERDVPAPIRTVHAAEKAVRKAASEPLVAGAALGLLALLAATPTVRFARPASR